MLVLAPRWQVGLQARYDTRESTYSQDCEFFQCQGEPCPMSGIPQAAGHRLCPDGYDLPHGCCPCPPASSSIIHVSGGICAPQRAASLASTVERAGLLRARPGHFLPCAHLAGLPRLLEGRVIARHYIDKICCPRYGHLAGRSLRAAGRHATCKLAEAVAGGGGGCRKRMQVEKRWKAGRRRHSWFTGMIASPLTASQHILYDFQKVEA